MIEGRGCGVESLSHANPNVDKLLAVMEDETDQSKQYKLEYFCLLMFVLRVSARINMLTGLAVLGVHMAR